MSRNNSKRRILEMMGDYLKGRASEEESVFLHEFYDCVAIDDLPMPSEEEMRVITERIRMKVSLKILKHSRKEEMNKMYQKYLWPVLITAGVTIIGCAALYITSKRNHIKNGYLIANVNKIGQGAKLAIMTLGAGIRINLENRSDRKLPSIEGVAAYLPKPNQLVYNDQPPSGEDITYITISVPEDLMFQLRLPDGTEVSLNSNSVIKFPNEFANDERRIELSGEATFDVVINKNKPFKVVTAKKEFVAKASHFNVKAYVNTI